MSRRYFLSAEEVAEAFRLRDEEKLDWRAIGAALNRDHSGLCRRYNRMVKLSELVPSVLAHVIHRTHNSNS